MRTPDSIARRSLVPALLVLGACARAATPASPEPAPGAQAPSRAGAPWMHDVITERELRSVSANSLYEAVARLRPRFLKPRTATTYGSPNRNPLMLYVDGERMESVDELRRLPVLEVHEIRFYEPQIANLRFARYNNAAGAIAVTLKQAPDPTH